ncbi:MAG TPA: cytochrome c oxidase assembly factor Coa1 family protein [Thermoanaerobaculia bacterium]|nr:cytochrome c oxidase assembly factor Coa1 family protein [Thermoanaerobaculia bacterium]
MTVDSTQGGGQPQRSWFSRNWGWVVAIGCLTPLLLLGGCVAGLVFVVFAAIRNTDVYTDALARAQNNPEVRQRLGEPVEPKWWMSGKVDVSNDGGEADFQIPISGPQGDGSVVVQATKSGGRWTYQQLYVRIGGDSINLLDEGSSSPEWTDTNPGAG